MQGTLRRLMDNQVHGMTVSNSLQDIFIRGEESEDYADIFSDKDRAEFITRLLGHLVMGGAMVSAAPTPIAPPRGASVSHTHWTPHGRTSPPRSP